MVRFSASRPIQTMAMTTSRAAQGRAPQVIRTVADRTFVARMASSPRDRAIVEAAIGMARRMGLSVVAEGVERRAQLTQLTALGCDAFQGWHLGRPEILQEPTGWRGVLNDGVAV